MDVKEETLATHDENVDGEKKGKVVTDETSASNEVDPEKLEEALNKLEEVFCFLPRLLIRRILSRDDVKGDLEKASQRLQEFQGMENPKELFKKTLDEEAEHCLGDAENHEASCNNVTSEQSSGQNDCKVMGTEKSESEKQRNQGPKKGRRRKKNTKNNEMQMSVEKDEFEESNENEFYQQEYFRGRGFRGRPWGAQTRLPNRGPRGGPYGVPRWVPRHQGNFNAYGYPAQNKPNPNWGMRGVYRGRPVMGTWFENAYQRGNFYRNRGRGYDGRHDGPVYLENLEESFENLGPYARLDFDNQTSTQHYESEQIRQHHNDQSAGRGRRGYRGTRPPKSMSSVQTDQLEGDEEPFEQHKLAVSGLNASTTDEGVLNFIEAMSGEEVEEVSMLGNGKALITMVQPITGKDFTRINSIFLP